MVTFSLCMIVKNEEQVLERCLESLKDLMDEMIIVDTGSTDGTKRIAEKYTNKIYDYVWGDDFSEARNFSFSKANMDYIYTADADEVIDKENQKKFMDLKSVLMPQVEIVQMFYCNQFLYNTTYNFDEELRPKLFKRLRTFQWIEPVHEVVNLEPVIFDSEIRIMHMPISNHGKRDFGIFLKVIKKGERLSRKLYSMYARELFIVDDAESILEAASYFENSMEEPERTEDEVKEALCVLVKAYRLKKDVRKLLKVCVKGVADQAPSEICYEMGEYFREENDWKEAYLWYYNAAFETQPVLSKKYGGEYPIKRLIQYCEETGNEEEAIRYREIWENQKRGESV